MDKQEQKQCFIDLSDLVAEAGTLYSKYLLEPSNSEFRDKIAELEEEGDEIESKLNEHFSQQRNIPYLALDRAKLGRRLDEILDQLLVASKTLDTYGSYLPDEFLERGDIFASNVNQITGLIRDAVVVIYDDFTEAAELANQIEEVRDEMTVEMFDLEKEYFQSEQTAENWKIFIAISRVIRRTNSIVHSTKVASEMIHVMSMKYL